MAAGQWEAGLGVVEMGNALLGKACIGKKQGQGKDPAGRSAKAQQDEGGPQSAHHRQRAPCLISRVFSVRRILLLDPVTNGFATTEFREVSAASQSRLPSRRFQALRSPLPARVSSPAMTPNFPSGTDIRLPYACASYSPNLAPLRGAIFSSSARQDCDI
jgi:hypothetical protein